MTLMYFMIGLPCVGKSTWIKENAPNFFVVSSDRWIEFAAAERNITYTEAFKDNDLVQKAMVAMQESLQYVTDTNLSFVWDQTNLSKKTRKQKIRKVPASYRKIAVEFPLVNPERLFNFMQSARPAKVVPLHVLETMHKSYGRVTADEGFDEIISIKDVGYIT